MTAWPIGANDLVLRVTVSGGFVPPGVDQTNVPVVSVYGDGRVITPGAQIMIYPGPLLTGMQVRVLSPDGMRRMMDAAAAAGLLAPDITYESHGIADAPTTFFTLNADGCTHHVNAYALMESTNNTGLDQATIDARAKLLAFSNALNDLTTLAGDANVTDGGLFVATAFRVISRLETVANGGILASPDPTSSFASLIAWPLKTPLATFGAQLGAGLPDMRCGTVAGADLNSLLPFLQKANGESHWTSAGKQFYLRVRPLLPDESGCDAPLT